LKLRKDEDAILGMMRGFIEIRECHD